MIWHNTFPDKDLQPVRRRPRSAPRKAGTCDPLDGIEKGEWQESMEEPPMLRHNSGAILRQMQALLGAGTFSGLSDQQLLEEFLERRDDVAELAFAVLVERHGPMVLGVCRRILRDPHDAEDAFQATFLVLARKGHSIRVEGSLGAGFSESPRVWPHVPGPTRCGGGPASATGSTGSRSRSLTHLSRTSIGPRSRRSSRWKSPGSPPGSRPRCSCATSRAGAMRRRPGGWAGRWAPSRAGCRGHGLACANG